MNSLCESSSNGIDPTCQSATLVQLIATLNVLEIVLVQANAKHTEKKKFIGMKILVSVFFTIVAELNAEPKSIPMTWPDIVSISELKEN